MTDRKLDAAAYRAAERLLPHKRSGLVKNLKVRPQWLDDGERFWYAADTTEGKTFFTVDPAAGTREPFEPPADAGADFLEVLSPDGKTAVFAKGHDLWARSVEDGREWALTADGAEDHDYGTGPEAMAQFTLLARIGLTGMPPAVAWSPDSTRILTHRTDQRGVRRQHLVEDAPADGGAPRLVTKRYAFPGDETLPTVELMVIDVASGDTVRAKTPPLLAPLYSPIALKLAWWAEAESAVYYLEQTRDQRTLSLRRLDPATGEVTTIVTESGPTRVEPTQTMGAEPIIAVFSHGWEVLWYSQRDNWGHLYLYDARTGEQRLQVTSGEWGVQRVLRVDEDARVVYFVASGLVDGHPYRRSVCRIGLDGTGFARLTDDDLDHAVTIGPGARYFIDNASTTGTPPVITVRDWAGTVLVELERADVSGLIAAGWTPPEPFTVKAADGVTDVHGLLYLPHDFDPERSYPVLDHPYPGPQTNRVQPTFDPGYYGRDAETMTALGFVVIAVDGRGTPGRDKAFHDHSYGNLRAAGCLDDHVAALRQLAATRPWMDLDRVGSYGFSGGGYATVRAMLDHPEIYRAGMAACGNHDNRFYHLAWGETYDGPFDPELYATTSNVDNAHKLQGDLLLMHGSMDDNVFPQQTLRLADALLTAGKDFEMLIIPGADHIFLGYEHVHHRRKWDFFTRRLLRLEPPADYRIEPTGLDMEIIGEFFE
ncbi:S9 family peptidase [Phytomonospora endophytica]|uniref:Dipeptidyl aminopeptidase/acylaminoacyl peptidase n=1 Tax=Phytomonospora endophytica TaxID=714109 RepID=A0A841FS75_9ACTN|nr:DPP IV N-terminal domain-containing protein [Phytomonospora endophytica]MBB6034820.1 dipeptidyl aminopeptidase/acylaminoacyl peptidase [Phytomonospora endophytica]GIG68976.1 putative dipeptidyl peptidase IV [Phytomonospora endophytica]